MEIEFFFVGILLEVVIGPAGSREIGLGYVRARSGVECEGVSIYFLLDQYPHQLFYHIP